MVSYESVEDIRAASAGLKDSMDMLRSALCAFRSQSEQPENAAVFRLYGEELDRLTALLEMKASKLEAECGEMTDYLDWYAARIQGLLSMDERP